MAQHIYMSHQKYFKPDPIPGDAVFNYRGEATGEHDDPAGFKRMMEARGHCVIIKDKYFGDKVTMEALK